ncbi:MAG: TrmB family transcriptional regulator [Promethearchaeota archaeon]|nr:MAG: TrmB family transcriptional regulator [Candidatus Lokiarchaeota archaeon]
MKCNRISLYMTNYEKIADTFLESDLNINSLAIIESFKEEGEEKRILSRIGYSTLNWDISKDIENISLIWGSEKKKTIELMGVIYRIIQNTFDKLVAFSSNRKDFIVGFKDEERKIISKISLDEGDTLVQLIDVITLFSRALRLMSTKEPYMAPDALLGDETPFTQTVSPKFLFDTTKILQTLGLQKFGLSPDEARVYLALLNKGEKGEIVGNLNKELVIKRTTIYRIIERLLKKNWVEKVSETPRGTQIYVARPITALVNKIIKEKEEEIKILKSFKLLIDEYLSNGWEDVSKRYKDSQSLGREVFDIDVLGIMGLDKDFGIIFFEYDKDIIDEFRVRDKLDLVYNKIEEQIEKLQNEGVIPGFEDMKIEYTKVQEYLGASISLKFKEGSEIANNIGNKWVIAIKEVAIPIDNVIYVIWGSEEKFQNIMDIILKLY